MKRVLDLVFDLINAGFTAFFVAVVVGAGLIFVIWTMLWSVLGSIG